MTVNYHEYIKTEAWRERAEAAKQRVGQRCQICNRPATRVTLDVHHRTYERLGNERPEDLTVLCRGCHDLYDKNRRMPTLPPTTPPSAPPQPSQPVAQAQGTSGRAPAKQPVVLNGVAPRQPFAPAKRSPLRSAVPLEETAAELALLAKVDHSYALAATDTAAAPGHYHLTAEPADQPSSAPKTKTYHASRRQRVGLALLVAVALLLVGGLYDIVRLTPNALQPLIQNTLPAMVSNTLAPTPAAQPTFAPTAASEPTAVAVANAQPTIIATPVVTAVQPALTATPTVSAPVLPTATPLPPTPTAVQPTALPTPENSVLRTGLVCSKPCSCAPVVRTITQGTPVTVLTTQLCGSDTWYQIADAEWLGPSLIDPK